MFILIILLVTFILILMLAPTTIGFFRARILGANIPFTMCLMMGIRKTLCKELIHAIAYSKNQGMKIGIDVLETHYLAGGSPLKCIKAMKYAKDKNINLEFNIASAVDLAGKSLLDMIDKASETVKVEISESDILDSKRSEVGYKYTGNFKGDFLRSWLVDEGDSDIKEAVKEKINKFLEYSDTSDKLNTSKIICETIIDAKFWESKGLNLVSQEIRFF